MAGKGGGRIASADGQRAARRGEGVHAATAVWRSSEALAVEGGGESDVEEEVAGKVGRTVLAVRLAE